MKEVDDEESGNDEPDGTESEGADEVDVVGELRKFPRREFVCPSVS